MKTNKFAGKRQYKISLKPKRDFARQSVHTNWRSQIFSSHCFDTSKISSFHL